MLEDKTNEDKNNIRLDKGTINWLKSDQGIIQLGCAWKTALCLLKKESAKFGSLETEYKSLKSDGRLVGMNFSEDIKIEMKDLSDIDDDDKRNLSNIIWKEMSINPELRQDQQLTFKIVDDYQEESDKENWILSP